MSKPFSMVHQVKIGNTVVGTVRAHKVNGRFAVAADDHKENAWFRYVGNMKEALIYFKRVKDHIIASGVPVDPIKVGA